MNYRLKYLCIFILSAVALFFQGRATSLDLAEVLEATSDNSDEAFWEAFPFTTFSKVYFSSAAQLAASRELLQKNGRADLADNLLRQATNTYLKQFPCDPQDFQSYAQKVALGEGLLQLETTDPIALETFQGIAQRILSFTSYDYEQQLHTDRNIFTKSQRSDLENRLKTIGFPVAPPPPTDMEKLANYVREGHWSHIWDTISGRYLSDPFILTSVLVNLIFGFILITFSLIRIKKYMQQLKPKS